MKQNPQNTTIQFLRQNGFKVRVTRRDWVHEDTNNVDPYRLAEDDHPPVTQIDVTTPDKSITVTGYAYRSKGDQFNRKLGNRIALNRALQKLS